MAARWLVALVVLAGQAFPPLVVQGADPAAVAAAIDAAIDRRLAAVKVSPVPEADDAEFLRRVYLDLHGVTPPAERVANFLDERGAAKRAALIDELLADPRFGVFYAETWGNALLSPLANEQRTQTDRFVAWLAERINKDGRWDQITYDLLTATGKLEENPAVTYLIEGRFPLSVTDLTDLTSRYFLGVRLNCAQCHDHPFVAWKQSDYWGMAAFFAQIQTPGRAKAVYTAGVRDDPKVTLKVMAGADLLEGFQLREPTLLGGVTLPSAADAPLRVQLARWLTAADNPFFARAAVNRLWQRFFGRGLVNPVDDMHAANEPSHPELLTLLAEEFTASGFDLKFLCRAILLTRAYGRTSKPGGDSEQEAQLFARMSIKVLTAEQLYDSLTAVVGQPAKNTGVDTRFGARSEFRQAFASSGDPDPLRYDRGIPHLLRLMNSPQFAGRNLQVWAMQLERSGRSRDENIEHLFLTILARRPSADELRYLGEEFSAGGTTTDAYRRLAWVLLLSSEFSHNH